MVASLFGPRCAAANTSVRPRVLLVHNKLTPFVRSDRDLLRARYHVEELAVAGRLASPWATWRAVRRCDVVVCWFASAHSLLPSLLAHLAGRPMVTIVGGYDSANMPEIGYGHQRGGLKKYVARTVMALSTRLVTNSCYARGEAVREARAKAAKISVVYHGIPVTASGDRGEQAILTQQDTITQQEIIAQSSAAADRDILLTVGNVDRANLWRKGLEPFVRAAALLPEQRFVLVGAWLDDAIDRLRASAPSNVTFAGRVSDAQLDTYLRRAAVYVQASAHEAFGVSLAQAMAAGCVPVVTRAGALPEVVGDAGIYAPSADPADLAAAITQALAAPHVGAAARARVATHFTPESRLEGLAMVIDGTLAAQSRHNEQAAASRMRHAPTGASELPPVEDALSVNHAMQPPSPSAATLRPSQAEPARAQLPFVSVVIPTRDEEQTIAACLDAVLAQDYPAERVEVLVVDGRSGDRTRAIVERIAAADRCSRVRLLDNPRGIASTALNIGIRAAHGDVIARVDGHTIVAPDYLRCCVEALERTGADNVGGLMRPRGGGYVGECIALATASRFGIGNSRFHYDECGGEAETVYLGCFRRAVFERVGLFDEGLVRNQDDELNDRILAAGGHVWLDHRIRSTYLNRGSFGALWRQYYQYGYWKVRVLHRHPHARRTRHLAPGALVLGLSGSALLTLLERALRLPPRTRRRAVWTFLVTWGTYGAASLAAGVVLAAQSGWRYLPGLLIAFWCLHVSYGAGFLAGLAQSRYSHALPSHADIPRLEPHNPGAVGAYGYTPSGDGASR